MVFRKVAETPRVDAGIDIHRDRAQGSEHEDDDYQFDIDGRGVSVAACSAQRKNQHVNRSEDDVPKAPTLGKNKLMIRWTLGEVAPIELKVESAAPDGATEAMTPECERNHCERQDTTEQEPEGGRTLTKGPMEFEPELS